MSDTKEDGPEPGSTGMERGEMKAALARAKAAPLHCAVACGDPKEGSLGLLLMSKNKNGKGLVKELMDQFPSLRTPCFGMVSADAETKEVTFNLNKSPAGLDKRLRKTLKPTGYSKVVIAVGAAGDE